MRTEMDVEDGVIEDFKKEKMSWKGHTFNVIFVIHLFIQMHGKKVKHFDNNFSYIFTN